MRPAYSSGERTSIRFSLPIESRTSWRNARIVASCGWAEYFVAGRAGTSVTSSRRVQLPLLAPAVEQLGGGVSVELEVPVGVRGEPVVVAPVQHDRLVVADSARGQQLLELHLGDEVAADRVLQIGLPVDPDGVRDVALLVRGGVLVDLDQDHRRVLEVRLHPVGVDEHVVAAHEKEFLSGRTDGCGSHDGTCGGRRAGAVARSTDENRAGTARNQSWGQRLPATRQRSTARRLVSSASQGMGEA